MLRDWRNQCSVNHWGYHLTAADSFWGLALVLHGEISKGIHWLEQSILMREKEGIHRDADWTRILLCEVYLEIISGTEKPSVKVLARNILTLVRVVFTAEKRIPALIRRSRQSPEQYDRNGVHFGRCEMVLGLLYKTEKKRSLALKHLTEAHRIISQFGQTPMLARIDAALAELG